MLSLHKNLAYEFSYYDVNTHSWKLTPGKYDIMVGSSVADIQQKQTITL